MKHLPLCLAAALAACAAPLAAVPSESARPAAAAAAPPVASIVLPETAPVVLEPAAQLACPEIGEASGIVRSRRQDGVFWTHNDSGDSARIFAVDREGRSLQPEWVQGCPGIAIGEAVNVDWEDISADDQGNLIVADCGNNENARRDLALYFVPEPYPPACSLTRIGPRYRFRFAGQTEFPPPPERRNFDCEAVFWAAGRVHLLTKNRGDGRTTLHRFDRLDPLAENVPAEIGSFPIGGLVTAADASPDGRRLAVLAYTAVWLFEPAAGSDDYFGGSVAWLPIGAGQCEAICFDGGELVITNEPGQIFRLPIERLIQVR